MIDPHILSRSIVTWDGAMTAPRFFEIAKVYPGSIADAGGVRAGMYVVLKDGGTAIGDWDTLKLRGSTGSVVTPFFDRERGEQLVLETLGFPWGMKLQRPTAQVCDEIRDGLVDDSLMASRILDASTGDYRNLVGAAALAVDRPRILYRLFVAGAALWAMIDRQKEFAARSIVEPLKTAAALDALLNNNRERARAVLPQPSRFLLHSRGTSVAALHHYASAMVAQAWNEPRDTVVEHLMNASHNSPQSVLVRKAFADLGVASPLPASRTLRPFPIDYELPVNDPLVSKPGPQSQRVRLNAVLREMRLDQVVVVIALGNYRTNRPYDDLIRNLGHFYPLVADRVAAVHVLTSELELRDRVWNEGWRGGEVYALSRQVPVEILSDEDDTVGEALGLTKSPWMFLLGRDGAILSEGSDSDDGPFWEAFMELDRVSPNETQH